MSYDDKISSLYLKMEWDRNGLAMVFNV